MINTASPILALKIPPGGSTLANRIWRFGSHFEVSVPVPAEEFETDGAPAHGQAAVSTRAIAGPAYRS